MKERLSYVILAVIAIVLTAICIMFTIHEVTVTDHKFWKVVTGVTVNPVPKPADPKENPSREHDWESYERFVELGIALGC